jgi:hypothetical protein
VFNELKCLCLNYLKAEVCNEGYCVCIQVWDFVVTPDEKRLVTGSADMELRVWQLSEQVLVGYCVQ